MRSDDDAAAEPGRDGPPPVGDAGYARLADLRAGIRRYLAWAEQRAREHGMTPAQVQLALAVRACPDPAGPTLTELADTLLLRHHSVVGLVDRAALAGLVERVRDERRPTHVHVRLTAEGARTLEALSVLHLRWLERHAPDLAATWAAFLPPGPGREPAPRGAG
jgi:DNA-binding MarR family transcriptional regulator